MKTGGHPQCIACILAVFAISAGNGWAALPAGLVAFTESAAADLGSSPLQIPQFKSALLDTVDDLGKANGVDRYLCWLKNDGSRVGYIAVAGHDSSYGIMAFSATLTPPMYFLRQLQASSPPRQPARLSDAEVMHFVGGIPLVATTRAHLAGVLPIETSETASVLASIFRYLQEGRQVRLFGLMESGADPEYIRLLRENPPESQTRKDPNWRSFEEEAKETMAGENVQRGSTPGEKTAARLRQTDITKPIIRRRLLNPSSIGERYQILEKEDAMLINVTTPSESRGMRDAILLQEHYLENAPANVAQDLDVFFRTRGRTAKIETISLEKPDANSLPAVLLGPDNTAGVALGYVEIDGVRFAAVFIPGTGSPVTATMAEKKRAMRLKEGLSPDPYAGDDEGSQEALKIAKDAEDRRRKIYREKGLPDPEPRSVEERLRESMDRIKAADEKIKIVEDRLSEYPGSLGSGVHLIRCEYLSTWRGLWITEIKLAGNWGIQGRDRPGTATGLSPSRLDDPPE